MNLVWDILAKLIRSAALFVGTCFLYSVITVESSPPVEFLPRTAGVAVGTAIIALGGFILISPNLRMRKEFARKSNDVLTTSETSDRSQ